MFKMWSVGHKSFECPENATGQRVVQVVKDEKEKEKLHDAVLESGELLMMKRVLLKP